MGRRGNGAARYGGPAVAYWITTIFLIVITARSLVHLFSPDGGAHTIATIDTSVVGGDDIIAILGQWGASQLLPVGAPRVGVRRTRQGDTGLNISEPSQRGA